MNTYKWIKENTSSLKGKTVGVSGATGGIGQELCKLLARLGARLVLLDRNKEKSYALANNLRKEFSDIQIEHIVVDLENIAAVKNAADKLEELRADVLILNAGAYSIPRYKCSTGYDNVFQINFVSPYYLARRMKNIGCRVVAVGSIAHNYSKIDMNDIDFAARKKASLVYGNAKRFLMFSLYGLFGEEKGLSVTHPGITFTNITAHYPRLIFAVIKHPMKIIFMKPKKASLSILKGVFGDCGKNEWIGPWVFDVWGLPKKKKLNTCSDTEAERICTAAERIYKHLNTCIKERIW